MPLSDIPFRPIRGDLYTPAELLEGYKPDQPRTYAETLDFKAFRYFVIKGRSAPTDALASIMEALHDTSITQATMAFLLSCDRIAGVMGGHDEERGSDCYKAVFEISRQLTQKNFLMASGGGPGAMEATHLGALLKSAPDDFVRKAFDGLSAERKLPSSFNVIDPDGQIDFSIVAQLHR